MSGDAYYQNVSLLLHCDGTDGSTTFNDSSITPKTVTASGNAHIETDQAKFGAASASFDGTDDYLSFPSTGITYAQADFTIECFVRIASSTGVYAFYAHGDYTTNDINASVQFQYVGSDPARGLEFNYSTSGTGYTRCSSGISISADGWHHVAACRHGTTILIFLDGSLVHTATIGTASIYNSTKAVNIGGQYVQYGGGSVFSSVMGYLDEVRLTLGSARYTEAFTAPAAAFSNFAGQITGVITDDASDPVARVVRAYRRDTGALVGNTTSSAGDGSYSMNLLTLDQCSVIALDDASGDVYNDQIARVTPA